MLRTMTYNASELRPEVEKALAEYRHQVFIQKLGWSLPTENGMEWDAFNRLDTVYIVAHDKDGEICGCARLLCTAHPYLMSEVFPHLMGGVPLPSSTDTWELSRFAISSPKGLQLTTAQSWDNTRALLAKSVFVAADRGAVRLIALSSVGTERLLRRMGVNVHRVAAPQVIDGKSVIAFWIEIDAQTKNALSLGFERQESEAARHLHA